MKVLVALLLLSVSIQVMAGGKRLLKKQKGRRLTVATMRVSNLQYNLSLSNNQDLQVAGNPVVGWQWMGYNNQVWDVQLHSSNGAYNAAGTNKWTFRSLSGGGNAWLMLTAKTSGSHRVLSIETYTNDDSQTFEYEVSRQTFRSLRHGKIDFGHGYTPGDQARLDGFHSGAWSDTERWSVHWVQAAGAGTWVDMA